MDTGRLLFFHCLTTKSGRKIYFQGEETTDEQLPTLLLKYATVREKPTLTDFINWVPTNSKLKIPGKRALAQMGVVNEEQAWPYEE